MLTVVLGFGAARDGCRPRKPLSGPGELTDGAGDRHPVLPVSHISLPDSLPNVCSTG